MSFLNVLKVNKDGYILEFGVHKDNSINFFHENLHFNKDKYTFFAASNQNQIAIKIN